MKIQIDFDKKTIAVKEKVNLKQLMKFVKTLDNWDEYELLTDVTIQYNPNPIVIYHEIPRYKELPQYQYPYITCSDGGSTISDNVSFALDSINTSTDLVGVVDYEIRF